MYLRKICAQLVASISPAHVWKRLVEHALKHARASERKVHQHAHAPVRGQRDDAVLRAAVVDREIDLHEVELVRLHRLFELLVLALEAAGDAGVANALGRLPLVEHGAMSPGFDTFQICIRSIRSVFSGLSEAFICASTRRAVTLAAAHRTLVARKYRSRFFELRQRITNDDLRVSVRRRRVEQLAAELGKLLQHVAQHRQLGGRRMLIAPRRADPDDGQHLAGRRNRALDQRAAALARVAGRREGRSTIQREQHAGAHADLDRVATGIRTILRP